MKIVRCGLFVFQRFLVPTVSMGTHLSMLFVVWPEVNENGKMPALNIRE
jgi:hypothetical protein